MYTHENGVCKGVGIPRYPSKITNRSTFFITQYAWRAISHVEWNLRLLHRRNRCSGARFPFAAPGWLWCNRLRPSRFPLAIRMSVPGLWCQQAPPLCASGGTTKSPPSQQLSMPEQKKPSRLHSQANVRACDELPYKDGALARCIIQLHQKHPVRPLLAPYYTHTRIQVVEAMKPRMAVCIQ